MASPGLPPRRSNSGLPALTLVHAEAAAARGDGGAEAADERVVYFVLAGESEGARLGPEGTRGCARACRWRVCRATTGRGGRRARAPRRGDGWVCAAWADAAAALPA